MSQVGTRRARPGISRPVKMKALLPLVGVFFGASLSAAELTVHAAASLSDAMKEIGALYEKESDDKLQFNFGASSMLARQIEGGAPADLFFSADEAKMDALEKKGLLLPGTRRGRLSNLLVIVVAADATAAPKSAADLARPEYRKVALAEPRTVPAGIYAREYLEQAGLWDALKEKVVPTESVRAALAAVESGNVDAGFVYKTDLLVSKKVKVAVEISAAEGPKISYPLAVLKSSRQPERAKRFAEYLTGPSARAIFEKFGFIVMK
jgi:molybdate transport system substrate-binding protein